MYQRLKLNLTKCTVYIAGVTVTPIRRKSPYVLINKKAILHCLQLVIWTWGGSCGYKTKAEC